MVVQPAGGSILQLHLPEGWPSADAGDLAFRYAQYSGGACETGVARLPDIPRARTTLAVAPASAVHFVRVNLPDVRAARLAQLLPLAVEEALATAPEQVHVVLVEHARGGPSLVAVVDKAWLAAAVEALATHDFHPARLIVETELARQLAASEAAHGWLVVLAPSGGFACLAAGETIALDLADDADTLPLALRLARSTHRRQGEPPDEILVLATPGTPVPDLEHWSRVLDVPVRNGGEWRPELVDGRALRKTDLLRGSSAAGGHAMGISRSVKLAALTAAAILAVHTVLTVGDWWRLSAEQRALKAQMDSEFRQLFPDAQVVVDAPLQLRRGLGQLRQEAGVPDASDFVPLLAAVGPVLAAEGLRPERLRYERGALELQFTLPAATAGGTLEQRLVVPGYRVRMERGSTGPTEDDAGKLVVTAAG